MNGLLLLNEIKNKISSKFGIGVQHRKESGAVSELRNRINSYYHNIVEQDPDKERFIIVFIIFYIIVLLVQGKRFYWWYPSFNLSEHISIGLGKTYPDNKLEIDIINREFILKRMPSDVSFFRLTDASPAYAFEAIISPNEMTVDEMVHIITNARVIAVTRFFKWMYNRARPYQISPDIINIENGTLLISETADTPSYPSGHALQSYYLAVILSRKFPAKTKAIMDMASKCANVRIMAGLHYPSDRDFAWWIVDNYLVDV